MLQPYGIYYLWRLIIGKCPVSLCFSQSTLKHYKTWSILPMSLGNGAKDWHTHSLFLCYSPFKQPDKTKEPNNWIGCGSHKDLVPSFADVWALFPAYPMWPFPDCWKHSIRTTVHSFNSNLVNHTAHLHSSSKQRDFSESFHYPEFPLRLQFPAFHLHWITRRLVQEAEERKARDTAGLQPLWAKFFKA